MVVDKQLASQPLADESVNRRAKLALTHMWNGPIGKGFHEL